MDARDLMIWVGGHGQRTGVVIADGYWHFIAVTWSSYDGATFLYVDGMLMFSTIMAKGLAIADGGSLMFGQDQRIDNGWCCSTLPNRAFTGQMAEISLWNKPLGLDDIRAQIDNQKDRAITGVIMKSWSRNDTLCVPHDLESGVLQAYLLHHSFHCIKPPLGYHIQARRLLQPIPCNHPLL